MRLLESKILLVLLLLSAVAPAHARDYIRTEALNDFDFGTWSVSGNLSMQQLHCIGSADTTQTSGFGRRDNTVNYELRIDNTSSSLSDFYLYLDGNYASWSSPRLPIRIYHEDVLSGDGAEQLREGRYESQNHEGQFFGCPYGLNSAITVEIDAADMADLEGGYYEETFRLRARNGDDNDSLFFTVSVNIQNGSSVRVSRLDTINFGSYEGIGNLEQQEAFCVHSTSAGRGFQLSVSPLLGDANAFTLVSDSGEDAIPLQVSLSSGGGGGSNVTPGSGVSGTGSAQADCNASDNVSLDFLIQEQDLQAASTGLYGQTLVLMVEPI